MRRQDHIEARLERLAGFEAVSRALGFVTGEHVTRASAPGVRTMRNARYHPEVNRFGSIEQEDGWVRRDVGSGEWSQTPLAQGLRDDPEVRAAAMRVDGRTDRARRSG